MVVRTSVFSVVFGVVAMAAQAEFTQVTNQDEFLRLVEGKKLTRPFVELTVDPNGSIEGMGARWEVTGNWTWRDGYFCRDLFWGGDELGYNCQEVRAYNGRLRFTSDKGKGQSAVFRLK